MIIGGKEPDSKAILLVTMVVMAALLALYFPFLRTLIDAWNTNDDYSHGYFIPFLSIYMIYCQKERLAAAPIRPANGGLVLVILGLLLLIVAKIGSEFFMQRFSLLVVLLGLVIFLFGTRYARIVLLPILYLIFMIPLPAIIWNSIAFPLQLMSSAVTEQIISLIGIPVFREGNILHLAETTLEVVAACSGLRSLVTMFALAGLFAFLGTMSPWRKFILFCTAAPIAMSANIIRLTATAILAEHFGSGVAHGFLHDFSGLVVFAVGLAMLMGVSSLLSRPGRH